MPTYAHTTYDASVNPVKCYVIFEVYDANQGFLFSNQLGPYNANAFVKHGDSDYYIAYKPTNTDDKCCCVHYTYEGPGPDGKKKILVGDPYICGMKKEI